MRPLLEILEDERLLMLKLDTIYQNMIRYSGSEATNVLSTRKRIFEGKLNAVRDEIREYFEEVLKGDEDHE